MLRAISARDTAFSIFTGDVIEGNVYSRKICDKAINDVPGQPPFGKLLRVVTRIK